MIGSIIREYIKENGILIDDLATRTGISQKRIIKICNGQSKISAMEYFSICHALDVDVDLFFDRLLITIKDSI